MKLPKKLDYCNKNIVCTKSLFSAHGQKSSFIRQFSNNNWLTIPIFNRVGQEVNLPIKPGYICLAGNAKQRISLLKYLTHTAINKNICLWELDARRFTGVDNKVTSIPNTYFVINVDLDEIPYTLFKQINQHCHTKLIFQIPDQYTLCELTADNAQSFKDEVLGRVSGNNSLERMHLFASLSEDEFLAILAQQEVICRIAS